MQRWWFTDDKNRGSDKIPKFKKSPSKRSGESKTWKFSVIVNVEMNPHEKVAVTGNVDELGNWDCDHSILMNQEEEGRIWSAEVNIPCDVDVNYRYFISSIDPSNQSSVHVRKWETHLKPRVIPRSSEAQAFSEVETFGVIDGVQKVDKGWLTNETVIQFKFFNNPFNLKERIKNRLLLVKLTAMNLRINAESSSMQIEESLSNDTRENANETPAYAFTEVATLNSQEFRFKPQDQFGRAYNKDDILVFHVTVTEPENMAYLIDLYTYKRVDEPPHHLAYHYLLPTFLKKSEGLLELPITCASRHRPLGMMRIEFVKITPLDDPKCDMKISYIRHWNEKYRGLDVGHRGAGTSFKVTSTGTIRENTIASLKRASESGADFVEFDVQLSKDLIPVIYHDFKVYVSLKKKVTLDAHDMLELPMRELTLEQLKNLKVYHVVEGRSREAKFFDEDLADHQPFPELSEALTVIDERVGFNIEVKWAQMLENGQPEDDPTSIDKNLYVDRILEVVLDKAGSRRIVFSCFDADVCAMLRNKQNIYPVMFLTLGISKRYPKYYNPCGSTIENAVKFCVANELLGIVAHTEDLLRDINQVNLAKELGLVIFCWGDDNNCKETIKYLKEKGLHAIIYDKVDLLIDNEKEKLFFVAAKQSHLPILEQIDLEHRQSGQSGLGTAYT